MREHFPIERSERLDGRGRLTGWVYRVGKFGHDYLESVVVAGDGTLELNSSVLDSVLKLREEVPALVETLKSWLAARRGYVGLSTHSHGPYNAMRNYVVHLPGSDRVKVITEDETAAYAVTIRPEWNGRTDFPCPLAVACTEEGHVAMRLVAVADWLHAALLRDRVVLGRFGGDIRNFFHWPWRRSLGAITAPPARSGRKFPKAQGGGTLSTYLLPADAQLIVFAARDGLRRGQCRAPRKRSK